MLFKHIMPSSVDAATEITIKAGASRRSTEATGYIFGKIMDIHKLKTDHEVFGMSFLGIKPWEIRKNDRDFKVGDLVILQETVHSGEEMAKGMPLRYTGRELSRMINYILPEGSYGFSPGWVVMTMEKI